MQDKYVGDVGDFVKYGLLRAIREAKHLGVAWYLRRDGKNGDRNPGDGKHIHYLKEPDKWRYLDPELFDTLKALTESHRSVANVQQSGILGDAAFAAERLDVAKVKISDRTRCRQQWFERTKRQLVGCDLVFADPDNGLVPDDRFKPTRKENTKRIPLNEATTLAEGLTAVIYHHNSRRPGGQRKEIQWLKEQLPGGTMAYYWRRVSNRTFFIINPDDEIRRRVCEFEKLWGDRGELV